MLPTKFRFIWPSGFGGDDFYKLANQKQELPVAAMFINRSRQNEHSLERTFHTCFLPSFSSFGWEFQRRRLKSEKLTDDGCQKLTLSLARWANKRSHLQLSKSWIQMSTNMSSFWQSTKIDTNETKWNDNKQYFSYILSMRKKIFSKTIREDNG